MRYIQSTTCDFSKTGALGYLRHGPDLFPISRATRGLRRTRAKQEVREIMPPARKLVDRTNQDVENHTSRHLKFLSARLESTLNDRAINDVTFLVDGEEVYAASMVLCAASDYFQTMLQGKFKEASESSPIEIAGVSKASFMTCLRYLYSGTAIKLSHLDGTLSTAA